jgi:hypothetical protein
MPPRSSSGLYRDHRGHYHLDVVCRGRRCHQRYGPIPRELAMQRAQADALAFRLQVLDLSPALRPLVGLWPLGFLARVQVAPSGCWLWTGARDRHGYGLFSHRSRHRFAHRFAYEHAKGPYPLDRPHTDHLCFRPACVNPDHLEAVTHQENMRRSFAARPRRPRVPASLRWIIAHRDEILARLRAGSA